jgi:hypothetical protein
MRNAMKAIFAILSPTTAAEPKSDTTKQITNSIGMKLTLIPAGEFKMVGESAEETAAFCKKKYGMDFLIAGLEIRKVTVLPRWMPYITLPASRPSASSGSCPRMP